MQNNTIFIFIGLLFLGISGCSSLVPSPISENKSPMSKEVQEVKAPSTVWFLHGHPQVTLYLKNLDNAMAYTMIIKEGLTELPIDPGHWQLTGFEEGGRSFTSMNISKKFVVRVRNHEHVYAGSIFIGCPKVGAQENKNLVGMKFFNRYPFRSATGLCEIIVGNDFASVLPEFKKTHNNKDLKLILGF